MMITEILILMIVNHFPILTSVPTFCYDCDPLSNADVCTDILFLMMITEILNLKIVTDFPVLTSALTF